MGWRCVCWDGAIRGRGDLSSPSFLFRARAPHVLRRFAGMHRHYMAQVNSAGSQIAITGFCEVGKGVIQESGKSGVCGDDGRFAIAYLTDIMKKNDVTIFIYLKDYNTIT